MNGRRRSSAWSLVGAPLCLWWVIGATGCTGGPAGPSDRDAGGQLDGGDAGFGPADSGTAIDDGGSARDGGESWPSSDAGHDGGRPLPPDAGASDAGAVDDDGGSAIDGGVVISDDANTYCECVFLACHDDFHDTFGEEDTASLQACREFASGLPRAETPVVVGNSLDCRQHWCDAQPADCPSALGLNATCTDG